MSTNPNHENCPVCNSPMHYVKEKQFMIVMDGNSIYQCSEHPEHKFWVHPFSFRTIHLNPKASVTNWDSSMDFKWENDQWVEYKETH